MDVGSFPNPAAYLQYKLDHIPNNNKEKKQFYRKAIELLTQSD